MEGRLSITEGYTDGFLGFLYTGDVCNMSLHRSV